MQDHPPFCRMQRSDGGVGPVPLGDEVGSWSVLSRRETPAQEDGLVPSASQPRPLMVSSALNCEQK